MTVRGVMFDLDGTLIDSNDAHARAWVDVLQEWGLDVSYPTVRPLIGMGGDKLIPRLTGLDAESDSAKALGERRNERFLAEYAPRLRPFLGVRRLLTALRARGITLQIATSAQERELEVLLNVAGIDDLLSHTTSNADAARSKPDPDIVRAAIRKSGLAPSELLMVGDTPYDIVAAHRAGVRAIAFRCGGWPDTALAGAAAIYDGPWAAGQLVGVDRD